MLRVDFARRDDRIGQTQSPLTERAIPIIENSIAGFAASPFINDARRVARDNSLAVGANEIVAEKLVRPRRALSGSVRQRAAGAVFANVGFREASGARRGTRSEPEIRAILVGVARDVLRTIAVADEAGAERVNLSARHVGRQRRGSSSLRQIDEETGACSVLPGTRETIEAVSAAVRPIDKSGERRIGRRHVARKLDVLPRRADAAALSVTADRIQVGASAPWTVEVAIAHRIGVGRTQTATRRTRVTAAGLSQKHQHSQ